MSEEAKQQGPSGPFDDRLQTVESRVVWANQQMGALAVDIQALRQALAALEASQLSFTRVANLTLFNAL